MLTDSLVPGRRLSAERDRPDSARRSPGTRDRLASVVAFAASAGLVLAYALPGGAYDVVVRQEYGVVVWVLLGFGIATGLLPRARPGRLTAVLLGALLAYLLWTALSLTWTESAERTTEEIARVLDYVGLVALIAAVLDRRTWRVAAMGLGFGALVVCAIAVASRLAPGAFGANPLGNDRLSYPFGYWNAVGAWAAMAAAMGLAWSVHDESRPRRAVALGLVPVAALAAYLSYSRATVAGMALGVLAVLAFSRYRLAAFVSVCGAVVASAMEILAVRSVPEIARATGTVGAGRVIATVVLAVLLAAGTALLASTPALRRARLPARLSHLVAVGAAVAVVVVGGSLAPRAVRRAWHQFSHPAAVTATNPSARLTQLSGTRYDLWTVALHAFSAEPMSGTGAGTYQFWWDRHALTQESVRNAHSIELENLSDLGAPGLVLILAVLGAGLALLARARQTARRTASVGATTALLAAFLVYVLQASVDWLWQSTAVTALALAGAAVAGMRLSSRRVTLRWYGRAAIVAFAIGAALWQLPGLVSTAEVRRSQAAERAGNAPLALAWADAATSAEPWSASAYEQRGLVLGAGGLLPAAAADLGRAIAHERTNYVHWLLLARTEKERGRIGAAERDYAQARQLAPRALVFARQPLLSGHRP